VLVDPDGIAADPVAGARVVLVLEPAEGRAEPPGFAGWTGYAGAWRCTRLAVS
jgi:hypothetical protein